MTSLPLLIRNKKNIKLLFIFSYVAYLENFAITMNQLSTITTFFLLLIIEFTYSKFRLQKQIVILLLIIVFFRHYKIIKIF